ncbi:MAG: glycosyltransferase [Leptolyngbya sp. SIO1E4]|nr:glycosyltransferase [Leptolyngbya sp. SIO1E4]
MLVKKARLGFVFLQVFSWEGGIQSYIKDVLKAYLAQPAAPPADVFLLRDGPDCENPFTGGKLTFHYLDSRYANLGRLKLAAGLTKHLLARQYRHVICGHSLLSPLVGPLCQAFGVPYTVMIYGKEVWAPIPPRQQKALQQAAGIWANSRYSRDLACSANGLDRTKFHMLPCIVNGDVFTPGEKDPGLVAQYGLQNSRVLMTVARLWPGDIYKGVDVTIRALPKILQAFPDVKYLVIGRGEDQPRLAQLAQDMEVSDRVVFAGFVPDEALVAHYRLADAYIMPSKEGFGIVYLEAMACGVPTLSGDDDGSADPLQDSRVGWRVPHRDPHAVAQACIEILQGEDRRCNGDWLREQTLASFSPESLKKEMGQLLLKF